MTTRDHYIFEKEHASIFAEAVQRLPSMYIFITRRIRVVVSHGAIGDSFMNEAASVISATRQLQNEKTISIRLSSNTVEELEWSDYDNVSSVIRTGRPRVSRSIADRFMDQSGLHMHIGGHQDYVESFGVIESSHIYENEFWRTSPAYARDTSVPLLVARPLCGNAQECPPLVKSKIVRLSAARSAPIIVKTSIAYTGKPSVTGTTFISTRRLHPSQKAGKPRIFVAPRIKPDVGVYAYSSSRRSANKKQTERESWSHDMILTMKIHDWRVHVDRLPVLYSKAAINGYHDDRLRRIDANSLIEIVRRFEAVQPNDNNSCRIVRIDSATVIFIGDIHSNIHGLIDALLMLHSRRVLNEDLTLRPSYALVFMGDYGHRGPYGIIVYTLLMTLKIKTPTRVFLTRGNHERIRMWNQYMHNGLITELDGMDWRAEHMIRHIN